MSQKIYCVYCGEENQVRLKMDGSALKDCSSCGANPLPMDTLLVNLNLGAEDFTQCPKCNKLGSGHKFCWHCKHQNQ